MGDRFQVLVLGDPGMEMMSESGGCMCYKHCKNNGFSDISHFPLIQEFSVSREGCRFHFGDFWVALDTLLVIFEGIGSRLEI